MNDEKIKKLLNDRDEKVIRELEIKYGKLCTSVAKNILGNEADAEECVNDVYLAIWNSIPPNNPDSLCAYICKITKNLSLKKVNYNNAEKRKNCYALPYEELSECIASVSLDDRINENQLTELINRFLGTLSKDNRVMFVRRYWYSDSVTDIAKMFQMRENAVSVKLGRIRDKLKKYLEKEGVNL